MKKLTIGLICPCSFLIAGGVQEHTTNLGNALTKIGCNIVYLSPDINSDLLPHPHISTGVSIRVPTPNGSWTEISLALHSRSQIRHLINTYKIDVLHFQELLTPFSSWTWLKASNVPSVATFHSGWEIHDNKNPFESILKLIKPQLTPNLTQSITVSEVSSACNSLLLVNNQIIPPAINTNIALNIINMPLTYNSKYNILFIGRLDERKGAENLVLAFNKLPSKIKRLTTLHIIGDGPKKPFLEYLINKYQLSSSVVLYGKVSGMSRVPFFQHADAIIAPTTHGESFGMVLIEALASGCPVIVGNNDGYKETLKDYPYQQYILDPKNHQLLANAITSLLTHPDHQKNIKFWAKTFVKQFDSMNIAKKHLQIYQKILE